MSRQFMVHYAIHLCIIIIFLEDQNSLAITMIYIYIRALLEFHFTIYRTYTNAECGTFQLLGKHDDK
jgi:hypothetical protein